MEIPRTASRKGLLKEGSNGTPEVLDLQAFAGRYVKVVCPAQDLWFNVVEEDPGTSPTLDRSTESSTSEIADEGTDDVADFLQAKQGEHFFVDPAGSFLVFEPDSGSDVVVIVKPTSPANKPPFA